jgi:4-diphosphocytidyl-2-C-methyl-D-erythritol kinase
MFSSRVKPTAFPAPAKLNLFLAVTGRRADGFHDLVSVAAPVEFGDTLTVEATGGGRGTGGGFELACDDATVPVDETNLVLKAAHAFRAATGWRGGAKFFLQKRIPLGAGLGGGSSDAVAALRALNALAGAPLAPVALAEVAARLGSDCALFLHDRPVVMRGRGERIEPLPAAAAARLRGRRVLIFKPGFGVATAWAYAQMSSFAKASAVAKAMADETEDRAAKPETYLPVAEADPASPRLRRAGGAPDRIFERGAEEWLRSWLESDKPAEELLFNNMERVVFAKFIALPVLLEGLRTRFGLAPRMSGSGSACFAFLADPATGSGPAGAPVADITAAVRAAWGGTAMVVETRIA